MAREILEEMAVGRSVSAMGPTRPPRHALGVARGDVRPPNLGRGQPCRVFVLDLSHRVARGGTDLRMDCAEDLLDIDRPIAEAQRCEDSDWEKDSD